MRIVELQSGISQQLTNEEARLLKMTDRVFAKDELDERQQVIANQLVVKDILRRVKYEKNKKIYYIRRV